MPRKQKKTAKKAQSANRRPPANVPMRFTRDELDALWTIVSGHVDVELEGDWSLATPEDFEAMARARRLENRIRDARVRHYGERPLVAPREA